MTTQQHVDEDLQPMFPVLDTLRAVGALAVLTTHVAFWSGDYLSNGVWGTLLSRLDVGVALFFVLSGFLLGRPYLARAQAGRPRPSLGRYYSKRLLRIYPVYAVSVVLALVLVRDNAGLGVLDWLRTLALLDIYTVTDLPHGLTQMWSLAVEVSFYVLLPGLMLLATGTANQLRPRRVLGVLIAMAALSLAWHAWIGVSLSGAAPGTPLTWLPGYLTWFAAGIALALAHVLHVGDPQARGPVRWLRTIGSMPGACWVLAFGLLLVAATPLAGPSLLFVSTPAEALVKHVLYAGFGLIVVVTGVFASPGYAKVMSIPMLRHLGHISYGVFCIHLPVISLVMAVTGFDLFDGNGLVLWSLTVAVSLVAAELLHRFVELPVMRLGRRRTPRDRGAEDGSVPTRTPHNATTQS